MLILSNITKNEAWMAMQYYDIIMINTLSLIGVHGAVK